MFKDHLFLVGVNLCLLNVDDMPVQVVGSSLQAPLNRIHLGKSDKTEALGLARVLLAHDNVVHNLTKLVEVIVQAVVIG